MRHDRRQTARQTDLPALPRWPVRLVDVPAGGLHVRRRDLSEGRCRRLPAQIGVAGLRAFDLDIHVRPYRATVLPWKVASRRR